MTNRIRPNTSQVETTVGRIQINTREKGPTLNPVRQVPRWVWSQSKRYKMDLGLVGFVDLFPIYFNLLMLIFILDMIQSLPFLSSATTHLFVSTCYFSPSWDYIFFESLSSYVHPNSAVTHGHMLIPDITRGFSTLPLGFVLSHFKITKFLNIFMFYSCNILPIPAMQQIPFSEFLLSICLLHCWKCL